MIGSWLTVDWILLAFSDNRAHAVKIYRDFVLEGMKKPELWGELTNQIYLGDESFINEMQSKISSKTNMEEIPGAQTRNVAKPIAYYDSHYVNRDTAICKAYESGAFSMKEIGDYYELHYSRISRIIKAKSKT